MATLKLLTPGQTLWYVDYYKRRGVHEVTVHSIDMERGVAVATVGDQPPREYEKKEIQWWRVKDPALTPVVRRREPLPDVPEGQLGYPVQEWLSDVHKWLVDVREILEEERQRGA